MATNLNYPYDPEVFLLNWQNAEDPTQTAIFESGAVQRNAVIEGLISNGSDLYTIPFYDALGGTPDNYDGVADITVTSPTGSGQTGVVFGRAHAWKDQDFVRDFNSGADPQRQVTTHVAKYWNKQRQAIMLHILNGIFNIADDNTDRWDEWQKHTFSIAAASSTVTDANKLGAASIAEAAQKAVGDNSGAFSFAVMHSKVASNLAALNLLNFRKYTDAQGMERQLRLADINGLTVVIDDSVPVATAAGGASGEFDYTTYILGTGALQYGVAPVDTPFEVDRNSLTDGGYNYLVTRIRETIHPNGFSFVPPASSYTKSPTDAQLGYGASGSSNWAIAADPKAIAIAKIVSNG